jgi:hypothetical protein
VKIGHVQRLLADLRDAWAQVAAPAQPSAPAQDDAGPALARAASA